MIQFIRSLLDLMAAIEGTGSQKYISKYNDSYTSKLDSGQKKRDIRSLKKKEVDLPDLPKTIRHKWIQNRKSISRFIDDLDYNNQIQSSYDLTLIERQNKKTQEDAA